MANSIIVTPLLDGGRNLVVLVNIAGDGSGDETNTVLLTRSSYVPTTGVEFVVRRITGQLGGFVARLIFDATTDLVFAQLPDSNWFDYDWLRIGGVSSNKSGAGTNGNILISTVGLGAGERGTFTLEIIKG